MSRRITLHALREEASVIAEKRNKARISYEMISPERLRFSTALPGDQVANVALRVKEQIGAALQTAEKTDNMPPELADIIERGKKKEAIPADRLVEAVFSILEQTPQNYRDSALPDFNELRNNLSGLLAGKEIQLLDPGSFEVFFRDLHAVLYGGKKAVLKRVYDKDFIDPDTPRTGRERFLEEFRGEEMSQAIGNLCLCVARNLHEGELNKSDVDVILQFSGNEEMRNRVEYPDVKAFGEKFKMYHYAVIVPIGMAILGIIADFTASIYPLKFSSLHYLIIENPEVYALMLSVLLVTLLRYSLREEKEKIKEKYKKSGGRFDENLEKMLIYLREAVDILKAIERKKALGINYAKEEEALALLLQRIRETERRRTKVRFAQKEENPRGRFSAADTSTAAGSATEATARTGVATMARTGATAHTETETGLTAAEEEAQSAEEEAGTIKKAQAAREAQAVEEAQSAFRHMQKPGATFGT